MSANEHAFVSGGSPEGHRERLGLRFRAGEAGAFTDEALLELLLSYAIVRRDVKALAKLLLTMFGNLHVVPAADPSALHQVCKNVLEAV